MGLKGIVAILATLTSIGSPQAQTSIVSKDMQIDALDPGIKLFLREKMAQGNTRFANDNVVLFLHGATSPSTCDFDLRYKDYSWADWLVNRGYLVYMGDYRNYGGSTREKAMDEPASRNQPVTRSYLALRDIEAMVNHIKRARNVDSRRRGRHRHRTPVIARRKRDAGRRQSFCTRRVTPVRIASASTRRRGRSERSGARRRYSPYDADFATRARVCRARRVTGSPATRSRSREDQSRGTDPPLILSACRSSRI